MEKSMDDVKQRVGENLNELREELGERTQEIRDTVSNYVEANPHAAVGIAFGVGYLLSGALFSRTTLKAATIGGRFALGGLLKQLVAGIGPGMIMAAMSGRGAQHEEAKAGGNGNGNKSTQR
jgi:hypothetical protein